VKKISLLVLLLITQQCLADLRFKVGKIEYTVFDNTITDVSTSTLPYTIGFRFEVDKDTYIGVYECNENILFMSVPNTTHKDVILTPPNSFGRFLGDYVCTYPVETRHWKLSDGTEVEQ
jgi:hypothetical protein